MSLRSMYSCRKDEVLVGTVAHTKRLQVTDCEARQDFLVNLFLRHNSDDSALALALRSAD